MINVQWCHQLAGSAPLSVHVHQHRDVLYSTEKAGHISNHRNREPRPERG